MRIAPPTLDNNDPGSINDVVWRVWMRQADGSELVFRIRAGSGPRAARRLLDASMAWCEEKNAFIKPTGEPVKATNMENEEQSK